MKAWLAFMALALSCLVPFGQAAAHVSLDTEISLSIAEDEVIAEAVIPAGEYGFASGNPLGNGVEMLGLARDYLIDRVGVIGDNGQAWSVRVESVSFVQNDRDTDLEARLAFVAPAGASLDSFTLHWSPVLGETADHVAMVTMARGESPETLGMLRQGQETLTISAGRSSAWTRFSGAVSLGARHIAGGWDHLAFLLALLLSAPMRAGGRRWRGVKPAREAIGSLVLVATGFTIGHSLSLLGVVTAGLTLPGAPVEISIAATVLAAAVHAIRPIFAGREVLVASAFGIVHGLGFAGFLEQSGAQATESLLSLVGFNAGIELMQVALLAAFIPLIVWVARTRNVQLLRPVCALGLACVALVWIVDRTQGLPVFA